MGTSEIGTKRKLVHLACILSELAQELEKCYSALHPDASLEEVHGRVGYWREFGLGNVAARIQACVQNKSVPSGCAEWAAAEVSKVFAAHKGELPVLPWKGLFTAAGLGDAVFNKDWVLLSYRDALPKGVRCRWWPHLQMVVTACMCLDENIFLPMFENAMESVLAPGALDSMSQSERESFVHAGLAGAASLIVELSLSQKKCARHAAKRRGVSMAAHVSALCEHIVLQWESYLREGWSGFRTEFFHEPMSLKGPFRHFEESCPSVLGAALLFPRLFGADFAECPALHRNRVHVAKLVTPGAWRIPSWMREHGPGIRAGSADTLTDHFAPPGVPLPAIVPDAAGFLCIKYHRQVGMASPRSHEPSR